MKIFLKIIIVLLFIALNQLSYSQLMKKVSDAKSLKRNENLFINKPLKRLLMEIKPDIKMITATPSLNSEFRLGYLIFRFVDKEKYDSNYAAKKYPTQVTVFVKEPFEWNINSRPVNKQFVWTKEDENNLSNLTVVGIRVFGEN